MVFIIQGKVLKEENGQLKLLVGKGNMILKISKSEVEKITENGVEVPEQLVETNPWVKLATLIDNKEYFIPSQIDEKRVELVMEAYRKSANTFLGIRMIINTETGKIEKITDIGEYRRFTVAGLESYMDILPVEKINDFTSFSEADISLLFQAVSGEILEALYNYNPKIAGKAFQQLLNTDPLGILDLPEELIQHLLEVIDYEWDEAQSINPDMLELLLEEAREKYPSFTELHNFILQKLEEERKREEKEKERRKEDEEKKLILTLDDYKRMERQKQQREMIKDIMNLLQELGVKLPLVVYPIGLLTESLNSHRHPYYMGSVNRTSAKQTALERE